MMAQRIAARLKGGPAAGAAGGGAPQGQQPPAAAPGAGGQGAAGAGNRPAGGGDMLQAILNRAPAVQLTDLQKGDAVMLVATEGSPAQAPTAITLLAGVEPILTASGSESSTILSPWNLGGGGGGGDASAAP